jgi:ubiquitin carboxyl-terminal hydrolase 14
MNEIKCDPLLINDEGQNPSGQYDLVAVLTHVGRAADSGHYIGWVKIEKTWCNNFYNIREV